MNIHVFVKRVPDTESRIRIDREAKSVVEEGLVFILNPYDEFALEEALRLRESRGGTVRVFTAGGEEALSILRKCLAMGADEAVLVKDAAPESHDGLRTARILAAASRRFPDADLLLFGKQSMDTDNAQTPSMTAELLDLPQINVVTRLEIDGARGTAFREIEGGTEKVVFSLPAVVSAQKGLNEPRYETLRGLLAARKKTIPVIPVEDLGLPAEALASNVEIMEIEVPVRRKAGKILRGDPADTAKELVRLLHEEARII